MAVGVQSFFPTGRAWIFDSSDWFRHHRRLRVWLHESVWISLAHTHTDWGLHTETHTRHFLDNTNPRVPCSDNNFDNQLVREKSIDPPNWCVCVIKSVLHSWFFILKLHSRRLQRVFLFKIPGNFNFFIGEGISLSFSIYRPFSASNSEIRGLGKNRFNFWKQFLSGKPVEGGGGGLCCWKYLPPVSRPRWRIPSAVE
jgi:hypothetical protein